MIFYSIIGYLTTILMVYAAISVGYSKSSNKLVSSVVCALIFYFAMEAIQHESNAHVRDHCHCRYEYHQL